MPLAGPPPLLSPVTPIVVRRPYRAAPAFEAGGRRSVRLAIPAGQRVVAPCTGGVRFAGRVAGGPPVVTVGCDAWGLRVTVGGITVRAGIARGTRIAAGAVLGRATGATLGLSVRRPGTGYVDPIPLLATASRGRPAAPPFGARRGPQRWRPAPTVHGVRTLTSLAPARTPVATAPPDRWLGLTGAALGLGALIWWAARRRPGLRAGTAPTAVHRAAPRR